MNKEDYFTFSFNVDPYLNSGYTEVFKQGDEPYWWYCSDDEGPAVGPVPNFTGASFKGLSQWSTKLL